MRILRLEEKNRFWSEQLRRMREMQYAYHKKFFHGLYFFLVLVIVCLFWDSPLSLALVPFLVITAGIQSCFYLHFVDFARLHARHLERQLNRNLGKGVFIGSEIEDLYFYPLDTPKIGGFLPFAPFRFFSWFTLHWVLLWSGLAGCALWRLAQWAEIGLREYAAILVVWGVLNFSFLAWYFVRRRSFGQVARFLEGTKSG